MTVKPVFIFEIHFSFLQDRNIINLSNTTYIKILHDRQEFLRFVLYQFLLNIMNQLASISERIGALWNLSKKDTIFLDDLQLEFRRDLQTFIIGETLSMKEGKLVIGHNLYKKWLKKIRIRGFDYEIDFK